MDTTSKGDSLGDRMKSQYENRTRYMLPRRTYTVIRVDGKAFHTFTRKHCQKPFDERFADAMEGTALALCEGVQGAQMAYWQSDEISVLVTDFMDITTDAWFDANLQKVVSVSASIATAEFMALMQLGRAHFDSRVFTIPDQVEVGNYFIWRQQDATRNSIQSLAQAHFSSKRLHGVTNSQAQDLLMLEKGINWNDCPMRQKRGSCVVKAEQGWAVDRDIPVFTQDREYLASRIPEMPRFIR